MKMLAEMELPLKDGDRFIDLRGREQLVAGEIKYPGTESVCWTRRGDWFRRRDGVEVTGAYRDERNNPVTISEAFRRRANSRYEEDCAKK